MHYVFVRRIYRPVNTARLLSEDEEKLVKIQETKILEYFSRKSKSPEPPVTPPSSSSSKSRKLSVNEVSPPVPKRRKKKTNAEYSSHGSETDVYKSLGYLDVSSAETWQRLQPIEQKDHWGLPPGLKSSNCRNGDERLPNTQTTRLDYNTKGTCVCTAFTERKGERRLVFVRQALLCSYSANAVHDRTNFDNIFTNVSLEVTTTSAVLRRVTELSDGPKKLKTRVTPSIGCILYD